ncbi:MAG: type VII toxin-antitoxin system HepT family RNase toxin [Candidatus Caldatribacteriaceae bacterium]
MSSLEVIENKKSAIMKYLGILQRYKKYSRQEIENDVDIRGALERYLYLAVQAMIDLAEALVAYEGLRKPTTMSEAFYILGEKGTITMELARKLAKMAGFRNVIAHDYQNLDYDVVLDVLHNRCKDIEVFLEEVSQKLGLR